MWHWLFTSPHPLWQWIGVIAGLTALGVGLLMTVPQMIWGKPHVKVMFVTFGLRDGRGNGRYLECELINPPVSNRALKILCVYRRQVDDIHVLFSIRDIKTSKMMVTNIIAPVYTARQNIKPMVSVSLPASTIRASIRLVNTRDDGTTVVIDVYGSQNISLGSQNISLPVGEYCALIRIKTSEKETEYRRKFLVGTKPEDLKWEPEDLKWEFI